MINYVWIKLLLTLIGTLVPLWFLLNNYLNVIMYNNLDILILFFGIL